MTRRSCHTCHATGLRGVGLYRIEWSDPGHWAGPLYACRAHLGDTVAEVARIGVVTVERIVEES